MASLPSYDNRVFGPPGAQRARWPGCRTARRARCSSTSTQVAAPPGSTFKLVVAAANMRRRAGLAVPGAARRRLLDPGQPHVRQLDDPARAEPDAGDRLVQRRVLLPARLGPGTGADHPHGPQPGRRPADRHRPDRRDRRVPRHPASVARAGGTWYAGSTVILGHRSGLPDRRRPCRTRCGPRGWRPEPWSRRTSVSRTARAPARLPRLPWPRPHRLSYAGKLGPVRAGMALAATSGTASILTALPVTGRRQDRLSGGPVGPQRCARLVVHRRRPAPAPADGGDVVRARRRPRGQHVRSRGAAGDAVLLRPRAARSCAADRRPRSTVLTVRAAATRRGVRRRRGRCPRRRGPRRGRRGSARRPRPRRSTAARPSGPGRRTRPRPACRTRAAASSRRRRVTPSVRMSSAACGGRSSSAPASAAMIASTVGRSASRTSSDSRVTSRGRPVARSMPCTTEDSPSSASTRALQRLRGQLADQQLVLGAQVAVQRQGHLVAGDPRRAVGQHAAVAERGDLRRAPTDVEDHVRPRLERVQAAPERARRSARASGSGLRMPASSATSRRARRSSAVAPAGTPITARGRTRCQAGVATLPSIATRKRPCRLEVDDDAVVQRPHGGEPDRTAAHQVAGLAAHQQRPHPPLARLGGAHHHHRRLVQHHAAARWHTTVFAVPRSMPKPPMRPPLGEDPIAANVRGPTVAVPGHWSPTAHSDAPGPPVPFSAAPPGCARTGRPAGAPRTSRRPAAPPPRGSRTPRTGGSPPRRRPARGGSGAGPSSAG